MKRICWMALGGLLISMCAAAQGNAAMQQAKNAEDKAAMEQARKALATAEAARDNAAAAQAREQLQKLAAEATIIGPEKMVLTSPVIGAPYAADEVTSFTQTLADGTRIQREEKATVYRDGQGRTRREANGQSMITDPVAGKAYSLDPNNPITHKVVVIRTNTSSDPRTPRAITYDIRADLMDEARADATQAEKVAADKAAAEKIAAAGGRGKGPVTAEDVAQSTGFVMSSAGSGPDAAYWFSGKAASNTSASTQSLGTMSIEGVVSDGTSTTETIPVGAIGNDRPIQVVNERWYSPELQVVTMTKHSDPRTGEEVFRLTNVRRGEPSPDLFQAPAGCQAIGPCPAKE